jgi:hypothetical protein
VSREGLQQYFSRVMLPALFLVQGRITTRPAQVNPFMHKEVSRQKEVLFVEVPLQNPTVTFSAPSKSNCHFQ